MKQTDETPKKQDKSPTMHPVVAGVVHTVGGVLGGTVGLIGLTASFHTLTELARKHDLPGDPRMYPLGIDLSILALILLDWMYAVRGRNAWFLRLAAWVMTGATVWFNAQAAKDDDPVGIGMHAVMPLLWVVMVEAARMLVLKKATEHLNKADSIPFARWFLSPVRTIRLWRRMRLWDITSYPLALAYEDACLYGMDLLRQKSGRFWRFDGDIPLVVRKKLRTGRLADDVVDAIKEKVSDGHTSGWEATVEGWLAAALANTNPLAVRAPETRTEVSRDPRPEVPVTPSRKALPEGPVTPPRDPRPGGSVTPSGDPLPKAPVTPSREVPVTPSGEAAGDPRPKGSLTPSGDPLPEGVGTPSREVPVTPSGDPLPKAPVTPSPKGSETPSRGPRPKDSATPGNALVVARPKRTPRKAVEAGPMPRHMTDEQLMPHIGLIEEECKKQFHNQEFSINKLMDGIHKKFGSGISRTRAQRLFAAHTGLTEEGPVEAPLSIVK